MKNKFIDIMRSRIYLQVQGQNIERFILKMARNKINILELNKVDHDKITIMIYYGDYEKLLKINTIYQIKIIKYLGFVEKKRQLFKYYHVLIFLVLCIMGIYLFSQMIFKVEIVTNDKEMRDKLERVLAQYNIKPYQFKKNYAYIQKVKENILETYHDEIEWIEFENQGTKYIIRYEPKILKEKDIKASYRHIIAKKNAIIHDIYASRGQIVKNKYAYVKKGDIIISGYIHTNDKITDTVAATGNVYGEVWYVTKVVYPFNYYEEKKTGKKKTVYSLKILNHNIDIFNFHPFDDKIIKENVILKNNILPISLVKQEQEEIIVTTGMNVVEEIKLKAIDLAYNKMQETLDSDEYIISYRILDSKIIDKGVELQIFFSVCENIGDYLAIEEMKEVE